MRSKPSKPSGTSASLRQEKEECAAIFELPIDGILDLHTFNPREVKDLVPEYLEACREKGVFQVRIIHGKGTGTLLKIVHSVLARHPLVESFQTADETGGGWGATSIRLKQK